MENYQNQDVHAPYHFVPLSKWVYMPDWAHLVSHDVPFKDGYSGIIDYTLTNSTPLCVGGEQVKENGKPTFVKWARDPSGKPVIPGSSLKGMIRNVLEIASFSKFNSVDDNHFSFRDISNAETRYAKEIHETEVQAYWIKFDTSIGQWTFRKVEYTTLFHDDFNRFAKTNIQNIAFKQPAEKKYQQWPLSIKSAIKFDLLPRTIMGTRGKKVSIECAHNLGCGQEQGVPVFSGFRPGKKEHALRRLNYSYMFYNAKSSVETKALGNQLVQKLFDNHDDKLVNELKKNPHPEFGIPIFARETKQGQILALGFAKMPRKLYDKSTCDVARQTQKLVDSNNTFDLAELMLGTLRDKGYGLKSRVIFSDGLCTQNTGIQKSVSAILGQPKASYLSAYLEQNGNNQNIVNNELNQYEKTSTLKGWKRYPTQNKFNVHIPSDLKDKIDVQSRMELMSPNSEFKGKIVFHNLKTEELGALLWTLKLQGHDKQNHHSLGHGKPLGAGAVTFSELTLNAHRNDSNVAMSIDALVESFIENMNKAYPQEIEQAWEYSAQINHLLAFGDQLDNEGKQLTYMPLQTPRGLDTISYTNSVQGRTKRTLPHWQQGGENLKRTESVVQTAPGSFAKGRLAGLIKHNENENSLTGYESNLVNEVKEQQEAASFSAMSEQFQLFSKLQDRLNLPEVKGSKEGRQSCNADIEQLLDLCLSVDCKDDFIAEFYALCKDKTRTAYLDLANSKKNKPKLQARKQKLAEMAEKYGLEA